MSWQERPFADRRDAGRRVARALKHLSRRPGLIVLALPRGGVPVAFEVAKQLHCPLEIFIVRKLGVPGHEELAMGAIATGGVTVLNMDVVRSLRIPNPVIEVVAADERRELERREREYRGDRPAPNLEGRTAILVDDGLATGSTMRAAVKALRQERAARIIVAVPVGSSRTCSEFRDEVDEVVCAAAPEDFAAVGEWYEDFSQTTDEEVRELLREAEREYAGPTA